MKTTALYLILASASLVAFSCKKKEKIVTQTVTVEPNPSMTGSWEGYYGGCAVNGTDTTFYTPTFGYSMIFKSNGNATIYNTLLADTTAGGRAEGTWIYSSNNTIYVDYTYVSGGQHYFVRANVDAAMHAINGKWYAADGSVGGLFYLVKK